MNDQQAYFQARIKRIQDPSVLYYKDPETGINIPRRLSKGSVAEVMSGRRALPWQVVSLMLGAAALMAARYLRFTLGDVQDAATAAGTLTLLDFGIAAALAMVLGTVLRLTTTRHMMAQVMGIGAMMVAMHNLIWLYPDTFAQIYTQAYVDQVQGLTVPQSLMWNGATLFSL